MPRLIWVFDGRTLSLLVLSWGCSFGYLPFSSQLEAFESVSVLLRATERLNEPAHEIMVLFVLRKLILQTRMRSHPTGLDVPFLVGPFVHFHTSCVRTAKALVRLRGCAGSPEPSLVAYVISTIISWAGSNYHCTGSQYFLNIIIDNVKVIT